MDFLKSISISFVFFTFKPRELSLHQLLNLSTSTKSAESELYRSSIAESSEYFMFGVVSVSVWPFVYSVKRIGDRTVPCGKPVEIKREDKVQLGDELSEND